MTKQKTSIESILEDVKKSIDRLAIIELIKSGATRTQVREVVGQMSNETFAAINKALKRKADNKEEDE